MRYLTNASQSPLSSCSAVLPSDDDEVLFWRPHGERVPRKVKPLRSKQSHKRHTRKYASGTLGEDISFYFRGPKGNLNPRAQNLLIFVQISDGVDDATWEHHLRSGDYSSWFRAVIKDQELADEAAAIEQDTKLSPDESRRLIREAVTRRYTAPATKTEE